MGLLAREEPDCLDSRVSVILGTSAESLWPRERPVQ